MLLDYQKKLTAVAVVATCVAGMLIAPCEASARVNSRQSTIAVDGSQFLIQIKDGDLNVSSEEVKTYVRDAARAVVAYYGKFPVQKTIVAIAPTNDDGVGFATSTHEDAGGYGLIEIDIGAYANRGDLETSWTLTHEMMHLAFPILTRRHRWLAEGIATYIEPIGRMRIGKVSREEVWGDLADNLQKGLPSSGDAGGLNSARGYGRIYWGGALYCLVADVQIRKRTNNRRGLEQALRAIANEGGTAASDWSTQKTLRVGDAAIRAQVLENLFDEMADAPKTVDIRQLLRELGVRRQGRATIFDDQAPLAHIRKSIEGLAI
ncbi:MAG: hypothetical protein SGJ27_21595 [Candidatus Melainabacteria bacterium]|nr:hypothetical protein [Candidatus Melainabacteria bacterium]